MRGKYDNSEMAKLYEEYDGLMLRMAFTDMQQREIEALTDELESDDEKKAIDEFFARSQKRTLKLINRAVTLKHSKRFIRTTLPRAGKVAACLLLVFFMGLSTAVATVRSVRVRVMKFIMNIEDEYTQLSLVEDDDAAFDVPADWPGSYYPSYIPDGFSLGGVDRDFCMAYYKNAAGETVRFSELADDTTMNIDTEDSQMRYTLIAGSLGLVSEKAGRVFVAWAAEDRYFVVKARTSPDEALKIAQSVVRIK